jgi:hypothetical protein
MTARKARRAAPSQELVPVRNPIWEERVKDVLRRIAEYSRTNADGYRSPAPVREMVAVDSAARLEALVAQEHNRLGTA